VLYTHAGPEVAVASTKAFLSQVIAAYLLGLYLGQHNGHIGAEDSALLAKDFDALPGQLQEMVETGGRIKELAGWMADTRSVLYLGRHVGYPVALEGALKLKELAYIHAEGFAAGELKHGPIALIEPGQIVFVIVPSPRDPSSLHAKVVSNIQEIRARGARVIALAEKGDAAVLPHADEVIALPFASVFMEPLLAVVPLHIFGMELAAAKGLDIDQPRNLAKSVTVE
jgi:glucosamine--fructose-6-phosphate aminotransferase (isomerizing)